MQAQLVDDGLIEVLRAGQGTVEQCIERALTMLIAQLGTQIAYVSEFTDGQRVITYSVSAPDGPLIPVGTTHPVSETICHLIVSVAAPILVPDVAEHPLFAAHPHSFAFGVGAHGGAPLPTGTGLLGAVCTASTRTVDDWNARDEATLRAVSAHIGELLTADTTDRETGRQDLRRLAEAVAAGHDLQGLTRPLLQLMHDITGLESTYLTLIDQPADELVIAYAHNAGALTIPEGLSVPWQDTLCRRALDDDLHQVTDVPTTWPDSQAARDLGIVTYVSVPIRDMHNEVIGTLCGASRTATPVSAPDVAVIDTIARLLATQLAREASHHAATARAVALEQRMHSLREAAERDPLTGLCNRTGIRRWLHTSLERLTTGGHQLVVAYIDLDNFKEINDSRGHATGDAVLCAVADALAHIGRRGDLHGRLGGDEFITAALLPPAASTQDWHDRVRRAASVHIEDLTTTASIGMLIVTDAELSVDEILHRADQAMYRHKRATRITALATDQD